MAEYVPPTFVNKSDPAFNRATAPKTDATTWNTIATAVADHGARAAVVEAKLAGIAAGATAYTDEMARDALGTAITAGSGITKTVDDTADTITLAVDGSAINELARDALGTALVAGANITITPNDGADTITIAASSSSSSTDSIPLKRFRQALAAADTTTLNWWAIGDSITESFGATKLDNGYPFRLLRALQKRSLVAGRGGFGYLSTQWSGFSGSSGSDAYWTFSGGGATNGTGGPFGSRRRAFAADETATLTFTGTSAVIHYRQGDASSVPFTVTLDGGSPVTVTPSTSGGGNNRGIYGTGFIPRAAHTVVVAPTTPGNTMVVYGASLYDDDSISNGGIRLYNAGMSGARSGGYLTNASQGSAAAALDNAAIAPNPALVTISIGLNDQTDGVNPSTTASNITSIIANVKAACAITPSFLLIIEPTRGDLTSPTYAWSQYVTAITGIATADPDNVAVLNLVDHFIDTPTSGNGYTRGLLNSDMAHPTDAGHKFIAQLALGKLFGPTASLEIGEAAAVTVDEVSRVPAVTKTASYTLGLADAGLAVEINAGSATNVTVPPNSSVAFPIGTIIEVVQLGTGQVTLVAGSGVTLRTAGTLLARAQNSVLSLRKRGTDDWVVGGDTS